MRSIPDICRLVRNLALEQRKVWGTPAFHGVRT